MTKHIWQTTELPGKDEVKWLCIFTSLELNLNVLQQFRSIAHLIDRKHYKSWFKRRLDSLYYIHRVDVICCFVVCTIRTVLCSWILFEILPIIAKLAISRNLTSFSKNRLLDIFTKKFPRQLDWLKTQKIDLFVCSFDRSQPVNLYSRQAP